MTSFFIRPSGLLPEFSERSVVWFPICRTVSIEVTPSGAVICSNLRHLTNSNSLWQKLRNTISRRTGYGCPRGECAALLKCVLEEFLQIDGVTTAALVSADGFLIESAGSVEIDGDALAALGSCAMQFFSRAGAILDRGQARQFVLEHQEGTIIFQQIGADELLAIVTGIQSTPGRLAYILPKISTRVSAVI